VIEGELVVKTEWGEVSLGPNEFFTVNPPDKHEFSTKEKPTKIIEIAYVSYDDKDIKRENIGGPLNA
jgi:D-lyxose ketol-isomerase